MDAFVRGVVVAVHHELAVAPLGRLDLGPVDARMPAPGQAQVPPVATAGTQFADPLAVLFAVGEAGQRSRTTCAWRRAIGLKVV